MYICMFNIFVLSFIIVYYILLYSFLLYHIIISYYIILYHIILCYILYNRYVYTMYIVHRSTDITSRPRCLSASGSLQAGDMDLGRFLQSQPRHLRPAAEIWRFIFFWLLTNISFLLWLVFWYIYIYIYIYITIYFCRGL